MLGCLLDCWQGIPDPQLMKALSDQALHLQHEVVKIGRPNEHDIKFLQEWMRCPTMGHVYLLGPDRNTWDNFDHTGSELVCLLPRQRDSFISGLADMAVKQYHRLVGHVLRRPDLSQIHQNTVQYSDESVSHAFAVVGTVLGSLLLVGSIGILYSIRSTTTRLVAIGFFTTIFSLGLCLFTDGRMVDIFSAAAA